MKHVLITGGSGFIGSHLCDFFLERGYAVTALDNLLTGRKENISHLLDRKDFEWINQDVCHPIDRSDWRLLEQYGLAGVLHFACPASPVDFDKIPFEILEVDSLGTARTVELALEYRARFLIASTSEIYGDPEVHPQTETYFGNVNTLGPRACYDETKRFAEAYVSTAIRGVGRRNGKSYEPLNGGIVRIFNTYGPRMRIDDGRIVPELCAQALQARPLTVHGKGLQTRSFCYVSDLVEGIFRLFESSICEPVNLGNPSERTVIDFANAVLKLTQSQSKIEYLPGREDDPRRRCPDITRAKTLLKWEPQVELMDGLSRTIDYFKAQL